MDFKEATQNYSDVALTLTKSLFQEEGKNSNVVFSPLSIHVVLSLIAAGSTGPTLDQLLSFLKSQSTDDLNAFASQIASKIFADGSPCGGPRLTFANGVWVEHSLSLKPSFKQVADTYYKAKISLADFKNKADEVISEVNSWVKKETNGLITELLPRGSVDSLTRLILANALYFKGVWKEEFDASKTKKLDFYLLDGSSVEVPFMMGEKEKYNIGFFDKFNVLGLPYTQGSDQRRFSMYFFLPHAKDGLPSLIEKIDSQPGFIDCHIPCKEVPIDLVMVPKFKIYFGAQLSNVLKRLGLVLPFLGGLLGMVDSQDFCVSEIFHKSFIEVNEEGTEAAAATGAVIGLRSMPTNIIINHPFLFLIREDKTRTLLFIGQVLNPSIE